MVVVTICFMNYTIVNYQIEYCRAWLAETQHNEIQNLKVPDTSVTAVSILYIVYQLAIDRIIA